METTKMCEENSNIVSKCLEFCQILANKSMGFNFSLTLDSLSFSLDTRVVETKVIHPVPLIRRNKSSPSTRRRNETRRTLFQESKKQNEKKKNFVFSEDMLDEWDPEAAGGNHWCANFGQGELWDKLVSTFVLWYLTNHLWNIYVNILKIYSVCSISDQEAYQTYETKMVWY